MNVDNLRFRGNGPTYQEAPSGAVMATPYPGVVPAAAQLQKGFFVMDLSHLSKHVKESDIEDWLWEHPGVLSGNRWDLVAWIGRQIRLPSGIADLVGFARLDYGSLCPLVVEVKNVPIDSGALGQVCRYAADVVGAIDAIVEQEEVMELPFRWIPEKVVFGPSIDDQTFAESIAMDISVFTFEIELNLEAGGKLSWTKSYREWLVEERRNVGETDAFADALEFVRGWKAGGNSAPDELDGQIPDRYRDLIKS